MPKDDIPVCNCRPVLNGAVPASAAAPAPSSRPASAANGRLDSSAVRDSSNGVGITSSEAPPTVTAAAESLLERPSVMSALEASGEGSEVEHLPQKQEQHPEDSSHAASEEQPRANGDVSMADLGGAPIAVPAAEASVSAAATAQAAKAAMPDRTGCGENCLNRLSYIHCDPKLCPCGEACSNRCLSCLLPGFVVLSPLGCCRVIFLYEGNLL